MVSCIAQPSIYTNYGAKEDGSILNLKTMRYRKLALHKNGYLKIDVWKNNKRKDYQVHRFVFECFRGDIPSDLQVDHRDNDKQNNCIDNLQLLTPAENCQKASVNGNGIRGGKPPISVISICIASGERKTFSSMNAAACALGVNSFCISRIVRNKARSTQSKTNGLWYTFEKA